MATELRSPSARFLLWLAHAIFSKRRWFFYPQVILAVICILFTIKKLEFHTSRNDLVGGEKEYHHIYMEFKKEFPVQDDLVVVVESESMEKNRQFVERLGAKLELQSNLFASVFYKGDLKVMGSKALFFLPEKDLDELKETLETFKPFLIQFTKATNLVRLFELINTQFRTASREENAQNRALAKAVPNIGMGIITAAYTTAGAGSAMAAAEYNGIEGIREPESDVYITSVDG